MWTQREMEILIEHIYDKVWDDGFFCANDDNVCKYCILDETVSDYGERKVTAEFRECDIKNQEECPGVKRCANTLHDITQWGNWP